MPRNNRKSFSVQMAIQENNTLGHTEEEVNALANEIEAVTDDITANFESKFVPSEMRQLALVAHNHMKPAM